MLKYPLSVIVYIIFIYRTCLWFVHDGIVKNLPLIEYQLTRSDDGSTLQLMEDTVTIVFEYYIDFHLVDHSIISVQYKPMSPSQGQDSTTRLIH